MNLKELINEPETRAVLQAHADRFKDSLAAEYGIKAVSFAEATVDIRHVLGAMHRQGVAEELLELAVDLFTQLVAAIPDPTVEKGMICAEKLSAYAMEQTKQLSGSEQAARDFIAQLKRGTH